MAISNDRFIAACALWGVLSIFLSGVLPVYAGQAA